MRKSRVWIDKFANVHLIILLLLITITITSHYYYKAEKSVDSHGGAKSNMCDVKANRTRQAHISKMIIKDIQ